MLVKGAQEWKKKKPGVVRVVGKQSDRIETIWQQGDPNKKLSASKQSD